jgi:MSHA biogenesis protein MshN
MSVINKMLQDLDRRETAHASLGNAMRGATPFQPATGGPWKIATLALVVLLVLATGWIAMRPGSAPADARTPSPPVAVAAPVISPAPPPVVDALPQTPQPQLAASAPAAKPDTPEVLKAEPTVVAAVSRVAEPSTPPAQSERPVVVAGPAAPRTVPVPVASAREEPKADRQPAASSQQTQTPVMPAAAAKASAPVADAKPVSIAVKPSVPVAVQPETADATRLATAAPARLSAPSASARPAVSPVATTVSTPDTAASSISVERQDGDSPRPERAAAEYRRGVDFVNQGRPDAAMDAYAGALRFDPKHAAARQALVALLMSRGRTPEAQGVLREGLAVSPDNTAWAMLLARLQVDAGDRANALTTLDAALPYAKNRPDYHAFVGTVMQMQGRHKEAITHYEIAVRLTPEGRWLTGLGLSLEDDNRVGEARDTYQRALASSTLPPEMRAFVERRLAQLK